MATFNVKDKEAFYDVRGFTFKIQGDRVRFTHDDETRFTFPWAEQPIAISEASVITRSWKGEPWVDPNAGIMRPMHYRDKVLKFYRVGQDEPRIFTADSHCAVSGVSADQRWIVLDFEKPRELAILDAVTRTIIRRLEAPTETIAQALVTRDKRTLIAAPSVPGNEVYFWDLMSGELKIVRVRLADVMALSLDNQVLAAAGHNCVDVLDMKTKEVLGRETYSGGSCVSIQFAPDGATYAIGEQRGRVRIFSTPKRGE